MTKLGLSQEGKTGSIFENNVICQNNILKKKKKTYVITSKDAKRPLIKFKPIYNKSPQKIRNWFLAKENKG